MFLKYKRVVIFFYTNGDRGIYNYMELTKNQRNKTQVQKLDLGWVEVFGGFGLYNLLRNKGRFLEGDLGLKNSKFLEYNIEVK
ncbi:hypothetical protein Anas_14701 [Armadillidium nasatum]|uniref:Uncharacterized protein n=1 Tax=Armadillidium nasatum TaxID=96803 RepID=A0A5N5T6L7_9CRUS|nr:hypothetical protein Anas_14408 [Armadillidium nasatum]KAB7501208.1 hypothetical protein Anas_14117 [Armadillidium nasatum]KAB7502261.1 hypothetical protein Anas_14694 [Armadillidium nasatum]KAB7502263.1 hypothetical protein Anas_14701 [Armadillidium nasatum]